MKIAVTGASGNLGSRVTRIAIAHGHKVVGIDRAKPLAPPPVPEGASDDDEWFRFLEVDVREFDQLLEAFHGCDAIIHLAAIPNPGDYVVSTHNLNVVASWNVLRAAAELGIERISQASSINAVGMVWGDNPLIDYLPMDEKHPCRPEDPYSLSKLVAEMQADTIIRRWPNMRIASLRLSWAVPNRQYAMGRPMDWVRKELWSWVDAEESARSFVLGVTAEHPDFKGHEVFFTIAPTTCQEELTADLVAEHWPDAELRKPISGHDSLYDCSKAERLLGWVHHDHDGLAPEVPPPTAEVSVAPGPEVEQPAEVAVAESTDPASDILLEAAPHLAAEPDLTEEVAAPPTHVVADPIEPLVVHDVGAGATEEVEIAAVPAVVSEEEVEAVAAAAPTVALDPVVEVELVAPDAAAEVELIAPDAVAEVELVAPSAVETVAPEAVADLEPATNNAVVDLEPVTGNAVAPVEPAQDAVADVESVVLAEPAADIETASPADADAAPEHVTNETTELAPASTEPSTSQLPAQAVAPASTSLSAQVVPTFDDTPLAPSVDSSAGSSPNSSLDAVAQPPAQELEPSSSSSSPSSEVEGDDYTSSLDSVESMTEPPSDDLSQDEGEPKPSDSDKLAPVSTSPAVALSDLALDPVLIPAAAIVSPAH